MPGSRRFRREIGTPVERGSSAAIRGPSKGRLPRGTDQADRDSTWGSAFFSGETAGTVATGQPASGSANVVSASWKLASPCYEGCSQALLDRLSEVSARFELERPFCEHKPAPPTAALNSSLELVAALNSRLSQLERSMSGLLDTGAKLAELPDAGPLGLCSSASNHTLTVVYTRHQRLLVALNDLNGVH